MSKQFGERAYRSTDATSFPLTWRIDYHPK